MNSYIVVTSQNGKSYYLAKQRIGNAGFSTIATFINEQMARDTAALLNNRFDPPSLSEVPKLVKGARR